MSKKKDLFSVAEACKYIGVCRRTMMRWISEGEIQTHRPTYQHWIAKKVLDAFWEGKGQKGEKVLTRHQLIERDYVAKGCRDGKFFWEDLIQNSHIPEFNKKLVLRHFKAVIPDVYAIREKEKELVIYEVEITHRMNLQKISKYADMYEWLKPWIFRLIVVSHNGSEFEYDMGQWVKSLPLMKNKGNRKEPQ